MAPDTFVQKEDRILFLSPKLHLLAPWEEINELRSAQHFDYFGMYVCKMVGI